MDELDRNIVTLLGADARMSVATLARRLKVARSTIQARLERLESTGVIVGYTIRLGEAARELDDVNGGFCTAAVSARVTRGSGLRFASTATRAQTSDIVPSNSAATISSTSFRFASASHSFWSMRRF